MTFIRAWFGVSGGLIALAAIYAYVPILIPIFAIAAGLGCLSFAIVAAARWVERRRGGGPDGRR